MNRRMLRELSGKRVHLSPPALLYDERGVRQPTNDDEWLVERASSDSVRISNLATGHAIDLGRDHIRSFCSNPSDGPGGAVGFLMLRCQVVLQGREVRVSPFAGDSRPRVFVPVRRRPKGELVLPLTGTPNKLAEAAVWLGLGIVVLAALEYWSS